MSMSIKLGIGSFMVSMKNNELVQSPNKSRKLLQGFFNIHRSTIGKIDDGSANPERGINGKDLANAIDWNVLKRIAFNVYVRCC